MAYHTHDVFAIWIPSVGKYVRVTPLGEMAYRLRPKQAAHEIIFGIDPVMSYAYQVVKKKHPDAEIRKFSVWVEYDQSYDACVTFQEER